MGNQVILYSQDFSAERALIGVRHIISATDRLEVPGTGEIAPIRHPVHAAGGLLKRTDVQFLQGEGRICSCSSCFLSTGMLQVAILLFFFPLSFLHGEGKEQNISFPTVCVNTFSPLRHSAL